MKSSKFMILSYLDYINDVKYSCEMIKHHNIKNEQTRSAVNYSVSNTYFSRIITSLSILLDIFYFPWILRRSFCLYVPFCFYDARHQNLKKVIWDVSWIVTRREWIYFASLAYFISIVIACSSWNSICNDLNKSD